MGLLRRSGLCVVALLCVAACNALTGVGDFTIDDTADAFAPPPRPGEEAGPPIEGGNVAPDTGADTGPIATGTCTCAPAPPQGWQGPVALGESQQGPGPACDVGLVTAYRGGIAPASPPPCTPCACGAPSARARCDVTLTLWNTGACTAGTQCATHALTTNCTQITYCNGGSLTSAMRTIPNPVGSCGAPTGGAKPAAAFAREATACSLPAVPAGACAADQACAPTPGAGTSTCIRQAGQVACPAGPYSVQKIFFGGMDDTRACSACSCNATCTGGSTAVYAETACADQLDTTGPNLCDSLPTNTLNGSAKVNTAPTFGCSATGGAVSGALTGKDPTTFCCLPP